MVSTGQFNITTSEIRSIASNIRTANDNLCAELENSKGLVNSLREYWDGGQSVETTIENFNKFYEKYYQTYKDTILAYATYLETVAVEDTITTDTKASELGEVYFL